MDDLTSDAATRRATRFESGIVKLLGGPGVGKTSALLERAAWLVGDRGVDPEGVLVFARDRRRGIDFREKLVRRLGRSVPGPTVLTWHAFCWSLLMRGFPTTSPAGPSVDLGYELAGYAAEPVLLTAFDQRAFVRALLGAEDPDRWPVNRGLLRSNAFAGEVRDFLLRAQERLLSPTDVRALARARRRPDWLEVASFYERYERAVQDPDGFEDGRPRLDFAMVLREARRVIGDHPGIADDLHRVYPHVLVDDFEEANRAEAAVLEALLPGRDEQRSALVAGDPDGTVYGFRGADPAGLAALPGDVIRAPAPARPDVSVKLFSHVVEEAQAVVAELRTAASGGTAWADMAIVVRDFRTLLAPLRRELKASGVPHAVDGEAVQLSHDPVVRPILDLFAVACERTGHEEVWPALLTSEIGCFSIGELTELRRSARLGGVGLHELCSARRAAAAASRSGGAGDGAEVGGAGLDPAQLPPAIAKKLDDLCGLLAEARRWAAESPPDECFWRLWQRAPWFATLVEAQDERRLDSLTTLSDALGRFTERRGREARMAEFVDTLLSAEFAPESIRLDAPRDAVTIVTAHGAKGRAFGLAVVAGCVEGQWPDPSRRGLLLDADLLDAPKTPPLRQREALEEEERLFRLALTRARRVVVTGLRAGGSESSSAEPSRFLESLGPLPPANSEVPELVLSPAELEVAWRRVLVDVNAAPAERVGALWGLSRLPGVDPDRWWWGRPWTDGGAPVVAHPKKTSYSRFADYENCPLAYLLGQVLGLDPERTYQMAYGQLIHGLLEDAEKGNVPKDVDALVAEADRRWRASDYPPGAISNYLRRDCAEIIDRYVRLEANNGHRTIDVERWFEFEVGDWTVRGKIDRIDALERNGVRLVDYKTSSSYKRDSDAEDDLQLATYHLACKRSEDLRDLGEPKCMELVYLRHERGNEIRRARQMPKKSPDGTPWDVVTEGRIRVMLDAIDAEDFSPSPEADCMFCSFKTICPLWPQGAESTVA